MLKLSNWNETKLMWQPTWMNLIAINVMCFKWNWSLPCQNLVRAGGRKGLQLITVHVITKDGLLFVKGSERKGDDTEILDSPSCTAEWIFVGSVKKGDYHKNMNSENFMKWVNHRLFPAFVEKYPEKKTVSPQQRSPPSRSSYRSD
jgi:hypothetical protein